jgi:hypothetical protein
LNPKIHKVLRVLSLRPISGRKHLSTAYFAVNCLRRYSKPRTLWHLYIRCNWTRAIATCIIDGAKNCSLSLAFVSFVVVSLIVKWWHED